jgi:glucose uptake protein GlcU
VRYLLLFVYFVRTYPLLLLLLVTSFAAFHMFANTQPEDVQLVMPKAALTVLVAGFWLESTEDAKRRKRKVKTSNRHTSFVDLLRAWTDSYVAYKADKIVREYAFITLFRTRYDSNQAID